VQTVLLGLAVVGTCVVAALGGMWLVRRRVALATLEAHTAVAGFVYAVVGVLYSVLLAFVVIAVWGQYELARAHAEREAHALEDLGRLAGGLAPADRARIRAALAAYAGALADDGWGALGEVQESPRVAALADALWGAYWQAEPGGARERAVYAASLRELGALQDARRQLRFDARDTLPGVLWAVLLVAGAVTVAFSFLFGVRSARAQGVMTAALAGAIGLQLLLIVALDDPFAGDARIRPDALAAARARLERDAAGSAP
jgi:hypothetical protein